MQDITRQLTQEQQLELIEFDRAENVLIQNLTQLRERRREYINRNELNKEWRYGTWNK